MDSDERKRLVAEARRMYAASALGALGHVSRDMLQALLQTIDEAPAGVWGSFTSGGWCLAENEEDARELAWEDYRACIANLRPRESAPDYLLDLSYGRFIAHGVVYEKADVDEKTGHHGYVFIEMEKSR